MIRKKKEYNIVKVKGYKMFDEDWCCKGFQYEVGKTYELDGEINICSRGFHFCKKLEHCFQYYDCVTWNHIAEVEALGEVKEDGNKCVTNKIRIVKEISWENIGNIDKYNVKSVDWSNGVHASNGVSASNGVHGSNGISDSYGVDWSNGVGASNGISASNGVSDSFGVYNSNGVANGLFLANKPVTYSIFGKDVTQDRYRKVLHTLNSSLNGWKPTFNNLKSLYLKYGSDWKLTPINRAESICKEEAWKDMPQDAIDYLKNLPEFDAEMFKEITGIGV